MECVYIINSDEYKHISSFRRTLEERRAEALLYAARSSGGIVDAATGEKEAGGRQGHPAAAAVLAGGHRCTPSHRREEKLHPACYALARPRKQGRTGKRRRGVAGLRRWFIGLTSPPPLLVRGNSPPHQGRRSSAEKGGDRRGVAGQCPTPPDLLTAHESPTALSQSVVTMQFGRLHKLCLFSLSKREGSSYFLIVASSLSPKKQKTTPQTLQKWYIDFWREKGRKLHIPPLLIDNEEMGLSSLLLYLALLFTALCWAPSVCGNAELRALMELKASLDPENALLTTPVVGRLEHLTGVYLHYRITKR
nr:probable LRR receptor-like serine/threonine-protein kinase At5g10290 [Ipomoea batatas]